MLEATAEMSLNMGSMVMVSLAHQQNAILICALVGFLVILSGARADGFTKSCSTALKITAMSCMLLSVLVSLAYRYDLSLKNIVDMANFSKIQSEGLAVMSFQLYYIIVGSCINFWSIFQKRKEDRAKV
jgi:hypothetical protein